MSMKNKSELRKRIDSFRYAFRGIAYMFGTQKNAWIHGIIAILVILSGIILSLNSFEWVLITFAIGFVFAAEAFNTAIETWVDKISPGSDEKAGRTKDMAAAAVLIAAITAAVIGLIIFVPKLL